MPGGSDDHAVCPIHGAVRIGHHAGDYRFHRYGPDHHMCSSDGYT